MTDSCRIISNPEFDNSQAEKEGWGIFVLSPGDTSFQLQKCDDTSVFEDDADAWEFVVCKAEGGSAYHRAALEFLKTYSPAEYQAIVDCCFYQPPIQERSEESIDATQEEAGGRSRGADASHRHSDGESGEEALQGGRCQVDSSEAQPIS